MELPIITFIQTRLAEVDPNFETRAGSAHYDLFVIPQEFMLQPLNDYMSKRRVGQSVRQMLLDPTPDTPTTFDSTDVDDLASNVYVTRYNGSVATTSVRVYYLAAKDLEFPALTAQFTASSLNFFNSSDFTLSASDMALQSDGTYFFADIPVQAEAAGDQYNVDPGSITAFLNDSDAVRVTNLFKAQGGLPTQTNTQLLNQIPNSIGVRDLETGKGISAILQQNFPFLQQIVSIGMGDPEMQRDIIYNIHTGARTDVYLKTPSLTTGQTTVLGLIVDTSRELSRNVHIEMARSIDDTVFPADMGTPSIVANTAVVTEDVVETSASISSLPISLMNGVDLSAAQYLALQIDDRPPLQFKVAGADPSQTHLFEIINAINAATQLVLAVQGPNNTFLMTSPTVGAGSQITINGVGFPVLSSNNAAPALFGISLGSLPSTVSGVGATVYVEGTDYRVGSADGQIYQTDFTTAQRDPGNVGRETITSGQTMIGNASTGIITTSGMSYVFSDSFTGAFDIKPKVFVRPGDQVTITSINSFTSGTQIGIPLPSTFTVSEVVDNTTLKLSGWSPTGTAVNVGYNIVSNQVVNVTYKYNPISVDIGPLVLLADGLSRGVRPGRDAFTIKDVPFVKIVSIQEIDPATQEPIGDPLVPPSGYGAGGYGTGAYGIGNAGDYNFFVNDPPNRYSMFEDSVIVFNENDLSLSYLITYLYNPELQAIHQFTRSDTERVTGADVLAKTFVPAFVDIPIGIRRDPTNLTTPTDDALAVLVQTLVNNVMAPNGLNASDIEALLVGQGVASVETPFTMTATVYNPDGTTSIIQSTDVLQVPEVILPSQTSNYTTPRITHFWPGTITITEVP